MVLKKRDFTAELLKGLNGEVNGGNYCDEQPLVDQYQADLYGSHLKFAIDFFQIYKYLLLFNKGSSFLCVAHPACLLRSFCYNDYVSEFFMYLL